MKNDIKQEERKKRSKGWRRKVWGGKNRVTETEENRRKNKASCTSHTSKSHRNARSPVLAPSNKTHTLSQECFNTLHAHNHVSNRAVNNWLSCLPLMALLQVYSLFHSLFSPYPLTIKILIKTTPWRMRVAVDDMQSMTWMSETWHHKIRG